MEPFSAYYGSAPIPDNPIHLKCGPLSLLYDNGTIRSITYGSVECIRRIYMALRDSFWNTIPFTINDIHLRQNENSFSLHFNARHSQNDINFEWQGQIEGSNDGTIHFVMDGKSLSDFNRNRIGLCILLPLSLSGKPVSVLSTDNTIIEGIFPEYISPHQPFKLIKEISGIIDKTLFYRLSFEGDSFEMEDQRNWTDASFKVYSTPLDSPIAVHIPKGTRIFQAVTLDIKTLKKVDMPDRKNISLTLPEKNQNSIVLPQIGLTMSTHDLSSINPHVVTLLQALHCPHYRFDLTINNNLLDLELQAIAKFCIEIETSAELALHCVDTLTESLEKFKRSLFNSKIPVTRYCIYDTNKVTSEMTLREIIPALKEYAPQATIASGTDNYFVEINRNHPALELIDELCYSVNPQVHTFDIVAIMENLPGITETLITASQFQKHTKSIISPLTLRPRKSKKAPQKAGGCDPRQSGLFCAAWTMGAIYYGMSGNIKSFTLYDTTGENGIMQADGSLVYPNYSVLLWLSEFALSSVKICKSPDSYSVLAFTIESVESYTLFVTNITNTIQSLQISGLPVEFTSQVLDENSYFQAISDPLAWNSIEKNRHLCKDGTWKTELLPFSILRSDFHFLTS